MSEFDREFWSAVAEDGPVPYNQLEQRIRDVLRENPEWAQLNDSVETTVLYSGNMMPNDIPYNLQAGSTAVAGDMAERGQGTIGIIDNTRTGQALGEMTDALATGTLEAKYGDYIDFSDAPFSSERYAELSNSSLQAERDISRELSTPLYDTFKPSSDFFADQITGRVITVTPNAQFDRDFAQIEIPRVLEGLESGRITHVNGMPRTEILEQIGDLDGEERLRKAFDTFNESFNANVRNLDLDVYVGERTVDGEVRRVNVLDVEQSDLPGLGAGDGARIDPPDVDGLRPLGINTPTPAIDRPPDVTDTNTPNDPVPDNSGQLPDSDGVRPTRPYGANYTAGQLHSGQPLPSTETLAETNQKIINAQETGSLRGFVADPEGRTSFLLDSTENRIYTITDGQVSHIGQFENSQDAGRSFGGLLREAGQTYPDTFKGLPQIHNSLGALANHIDDLADPAWRRALRNFGEGVADVGGRATKILGPLGVAAAGAEAYSLEMKLQDYEEYDLVPSDAMLAYRAILTGHTAQATVDPTLLGGEIPVQLAYDEWVDRYNISPEVSEALEPGSLLEDLDAARQWLDAQAAAAGVAVRDYAVDRWNNPEKIADDLERIGNAAWNTGEAALEVINDGADAVEGYVRTRWNDPSKLGEDAQAIGDTIGGAATGAWNELFGDDQPSQLEQNLQNNRTVPLDDVILQFDRDRSLLREMDPQSELIETRAANHPEAEAMFERLNTGGVTRLPASVMAGRTPGERMSNMLEQARDTDLELAAQQSRSADVNVNNDEYDYALG